MKYFLSILTALLLLFSCSMDENIDMGNSSLTLNIKNKSGNSKAVWPAQFNAKLTLSSPQFSDITADLTIVRTVIASDSGLADTIYRANKLVEVPINAAFKLKLAATINSVNYEFIKDSVVVNEETNVTVDAYLEPLVANTPPVISQISNATIPANTTHSTDFSVSDKETPATNLIVRATSSNQNLMPDKSITISGTGNNRSLTAMPVTGQTGSTTVTLIVYDEGKMTDTTSFTLTVATQGSNTPPTISQMSNATINANASYGPISFTVNDAETPAASLTVTAISNNATLLPSSRIILGGTGTSRAVTATPVTDQSGSATITLTVRDGGDMTSSTSFTLTVNTLGLTNKFIMVEGGTFQMGDASITNATPVHPVTLSSFYIEKYEVLQSEWIATMGSNPSNFTGDLNRPVENISWYDILVYCNKRSIADSLTPCYTINGSTNPTTWGTVPSTSNATWNAVTCNFAAKGYRMPTEAEWEFAARGGNFTQNYTYSGSNVVDDVAWSDLNSGFTTHVVGTKTPNELGLYDMTGNVRERNWDWDGNYTATAQTNPTGATTGSIRLCRGGGYTDGADFCGVAYRYSFIPQLGGYDKGFRLARTP